VDASPQSEPPARQSGFLNRAGAPHCAHNGRHAMLALPHLIVRVAVTGHRDIHPTNEPAIRASIRAILHQVLATTAPLASVENSAYSLAPPVLRILSSLAEGADRVVVEEALALQTLHTVTLECPLPTARAEYRKDFKTPESQKAFDGLLAHAAAVFELDGQRDGEWLRSSDYARAGHIAVSNCDLLIAIWDGNRGKPGGTADIAQEAMNRQIPVIRIDVYNPPSITVCAPPGDWDGKWQAALHESLLVTLKAPKDAVEWVSRYCGENIGVEADENRRADLLASRYGKLFRASYYWKYGLAAFAVFFAVAGMMPGWQISLWPALELTSILGILLCFALPWRFEWHGRWLDYRLLAEQFRVREFLRGLGETPPVFQPPKYWGVPSERHICVRWYFQARLREYGLANAIVTSGYVRDRRQDILAVTREQYSYNWNKHESAENRHQFMERCGLFLFGMTAVACVVHLGELAPALILGAITATLPAFGAAMEGLQAQAESKRIAGYAHAMAKHLENVEARIEALPAGAGLESIRKIAVELATEMTRETSGWHNLIHGQPPKV
jgi:hypothetical protein